MPKHWVFEQALSEDEAGQERKPQTRLKSMEGMISGSSRDWIPKSGSLVSRSKVPE